MAPCCNPGIVPDRQRHVLTVVLVINLAMFLIEFAAPGTTWSPTWGVLVAALGVRLTDRAWPDIVVGVAIAGLLVTSAAGVIRAALRPAATGRAA